MEVAEEPLFLDGFADLLSHQISWFWPETLTLIFEYYHLSDYDNLTVAGKYTKLLRVINNGMIHRTEKDASFDKYLRKMRKDKVLYICGIIACILFLPMYRLIYRNPIVFSLSILCLFIVKFYIKNSNNDNTYD